MNTTNQKSDIKEEVKEFQGHTSSTLEEFIGNQQAQKQNGNPMDDPVEQAHFRKIVAAFFFYQVSSRGASSDFDLFCFGRLRRCAT